MATHSNGRSVDATGAVAIDPSLNVSALVEAERLLQTEMRKAESRRQDDLRLAAKELAANHHEHEKEIANLRESHSKEMAAKESSRVDSLRQGDREEGVRSATAAQNNIAALASTTTALAENLRNQVKVTADAAESRHVAYSTDVAKRLTAVELSLSEGKGKQTIADPQQERLALAVEKLVAGGDRSTGKVEGIDAFWKVLIALAALFFGWSAWQDRQAQAPVSPQYIYTPSPPGTLLPSTPPQQIPR